MYEYTTTTELARDLRRIEAKVDRLGVMVETALGIGKTAVEMAVMTEKLREATAELNAAIEASTPTSPPPPP